VGHRLAALRGALARLRPSPRARTRTLLRDHRRLVGPRTLWARDEARGLVAAAQLQLASGEVARWDGELAGARASVCLVDELEHPLEGWTVHIRAWWRCGTWWIRRARSRRPGRVWINDCPEACLPGRLRPHRAGRSYASRRCKTGRRGAVRVPTHDTSSVEGGCWIRAARRLSGQLILYSLPTTLDRSGRARRAGSFGLRAARAYLLLLRLETTSAIVAQLNVERATAATWAC
jgi:hypothetical protein